MQEYIEYLNNVLTVTGGFLALLASAMMFRKRLFAIIDRSATIDKLALVRSIIFGRPVPTTWSGSCPVFWHTETNMNLHYDMRRLHRATVREILTKMRAADSEDGRYFVEDFTGLESINDYGISHYVFFGSLLSNKYELASIYFVIPDNVHGLARFRNELLRLNKPTLHVVSDPRQAPAMRTKYCAPCKSNAPTDPCAP